ncbi:MAG TPA: TraR/DksA family transcriptional regulator [Rhodobacteraceae bacterium]|nr:TraR/DksA family transcriptional regulator [Paracoccaceae bacterium]
MGAISRMNDHVSAQFRVRLEAMLADLDEQNTRGRTGQRTVTLDQQSVGRLSRMDAMQHQAMAQATKIRREQQKARIIAALGRIEEGEFGYCLGCGEEIAPARLELDPTVPNCLACAKSAPGPRT